MDRRDALKAVGAMGLASMENVLLAAEQPTKPQGAADSYSGDAANGAPTAVPQLRRKEKLMADDRAREVLSRAATGRLATVSRDGSPYVVPLSYVFRNGEIWFHHALGSGHLRNNFDRDRRVCFEVDERGEVYASGPTECNTSLSYRSVIAFGRVRDIDDQAEKKSFFDAFMQKYSDPKWDRPKGVYPRLDKIGVCAIAIERMTGKEAILPPADKRWPGADKTKTSGTAG